VEDWFAARETGGMAGNDGGSESPRAQQRALAIIRGIVVRTRLGWVSGELGARRCHLFARRAYTMTLRIRVENRSGIVRDAWGKANL